MGAEPFPVVRMMGQESPWHPAMEINGREGGMTLEAGPKLGHFTSLNILASIQTPSPDYIFYPL